MGCFNVSTADVITREQIERLSRLSCRGLSARWANKLSPVALMGISSGCINATTGKFWNGVNAGFIKSLPADVFSAVNLAIFPSRLWKFVLLEQFDMITPKAIARLTADGSCALCLDHTKLTVSICALGAAALPDEFIGTIGIDRASALSQAACEAMNVGALSVSTWSQLSDSNCAKGAGIDKLDSSRIYVLSNETCGVIRLVKLSADQFSAFTNDCIAHWSYCNDFDLSNAATMSDEAFLLLRAGCTDSFHPPIFTTLNAKKVSHIMENGEAICLHWNAAVLFALPAEAYAGVTPNCVRYWAAALEDACIGLPAEAALYLPITAYAELSERCLGSASTDFLGRVSAAGAGQWTSRQFHYSGFNILPFLSIEALRALGADALRQMPSRAWDALTEYAPRTQYGCQLISLSCRS